MWTITPFPLAVALGQRFDPAAIALGSFAVIAVGGLGCIAGGILSRRFGSARAVVRMA